MTRLPTPVPARLASLIALAAPITLTAAPVAANPVPCGPRAQVLAELTQRHGETRHGLGLAGPSAVVELYAAESGSWTILVTRPDGLACLLASGQGWQSLAEALPALGDPA
ncbi:MAG: hypothetical protein IE927_03635 [Rhodobacterales bacterium]|nr:hypothetical protein [Rhodobacterales bacterium]